MPFYYFLKVPAETMSLLTLPPELFAMIIKQLDIDSIFNLYEAGLKRLQGFITECDFSSPSLATTKTLETDFFISVSRSLRVLNLSGIVYVDRALLLDALKRTTSLMDLDVSYTNITMPDFLKISSATPTLKNIAINFSFIGEDNKIMEEVLCHVRDRELGSYQKAFQRFENVHFVGRLHARVHGALALLVLRHAALSNLRFSTTGAVEGWRLDLASWTADMVKTKQFQLYFYKIPRRHLLIDTHIYTVMDFAKYEAIIFKLSHGTMEFADSRVSTVFATPRLKLLLNERYSVNILSLPNPLSRDGLACSIAVTRPVAGVDYTCLFWDAERVDFDDAFRSKLHEMFTQHTSTCLSAKQRREYRRATAAVKCVHTFRIR